MDDLVNFTLPPIISGARNTSIDEDSVLPLVSEGTGGAGIEFGKDDFVLLFNLLPPKNVTAFAVFTTALDMDMGNGEFGMFSD